MKFSDEFSGNIEAHAGDHLDGNSRFRCGNFDWSVDDYSLSYRLEHVIFQDLRDLDQARL